MTSGGTFGSNHYDNFGDEYNNRNVSHNLLSQAGSQFGDDDALSSHYQGMSEYGGISNIGAHENDHAKPTTDGSRRQ